MTINVSGFGLSIAMRASNTFPNGLTITAFADDADPLDSANYAAADTGTGLNGDLVVWSRASHQEIVISVIPMSDDDRNLEILLNANRVGKNKSGARDIIDAVINYPDQSKGTCSNGAIIDGSLLPSIASNGKTKSRQYRFRFESTVKV